MLDEGLHYLLQFDEVGQVDVHHVAGVELGVGDVFAVGGVQRHVVERVANGVNGADEVAPAADHEDAHVGILVHGAGEPARRAGVVVWRAVIPGLHTGDDFIGQIVLEFQFAADVIIHGRGKGTVDCGVGGVEVGVFRGRVVVAAGEAGVVGAEDESLVVQQLLAEDVGVNPQVVVHDDVGGKAGEAGKFGGDFFAPGVGQGIALLQGGGVFAFGKGAAFGERGVEVALQIGREFVVKMSGGGVGGQVERIGNVVARIVGDGFKVQDAGDENEAVQIHSIAVAQMVGEAGGTEDAVAFAAEIFGREPAVVARGPEPDKFTDGIEVLGVAEKVVGITRRAAEAGGHRVNEDEVAGVQKGVVVVHELERWRGQGAVGIHFHAARAEGAHVQPDGGGAGTAVETKGDGTFGLVLITQPRVGDVKDGGNRSAVILEHGQHSGLSDVFDALTGDGDGVGGKDGGVGGVGEGHFIFERRGVGVVVGRRLGRGQGQLRGERERQHQKKSIHNIWSLENAGFFGKGKSESWSEDGGWGMEDGCVLRWTCCDKPGNGWVD